MMNNVKELPALAWRAKLQITSTGSTRPNLFNACMPLRLASEFRNAFYYDQFSMHTLITRALPWNDEIDRYWDNHDDNYATEWLQGAGIQVKRETAQQAIEIVAYERRNHTLRTWLSGLQWDGKPRVNQWLTYYLGVDPTPYTAAIGQAWLISAVARGIVPGCKVDHTLVLEGKQNARKSTAIKTLASPKWFTDELADFGSKDAAMQMRGVWIIEMAEMDHMGRSDASRIKAFLTRTTDRFRPPFGHRIIEAPRECVFAGTVNNAEYLKDETGNRRFWPVRVTSIDIDALEVDREQLWAEAVALYRQGEPWWIVDRDVELMAQTEQAERNEDDPWLEIVSDWMARNPDRLRGLTTKELLLSAVVKRAADVQERDAKRIGRVMKLLGYEQKTARVGGQCLRCWIPISD